ncbi:Ribonuclease Oy-like [Oopsacas minuta]|uniref:Ribonuclease Oy-like n=1 Tax=Oopsacas minuta TaxID=111878 RepID=A0AAV7K1P9_9METZ|nr:Ribonuclease Oy-like [Oopsacas minuta]
MIGCKYSLLLLLLIQSTHLCTADEVSYDYIVLALTWPPGFCTSIGNECDSSKVRNIWTIHGLWPTLKQQTSNPAFCDGEPFNSNYLSAKLLNQLTASWPNYKQSSTDELFWNYEWSKHGTCAVQGDYDTFPSQSAYFSRTLELYNTYNFSSILTNNDIYPGSTTFLSELKSTFSRFFGLSNTVTFQCSTHNNRHYVTSCHFCLSSNFSVISCPSGKTDSCQYSYPIVYSSRADMVDCYLFLFMFLLLFVIEML